MICYTITMKENKKARFFCESCDTEVVGDAKFCPNCGRFFSSVRCPACELTGEHFLFENGCPACGYAMDGSPFDTSVSPNQRRKAYRKHQNAEYKKNTSKGSSLYNYSAQPRKRGSDDPLPVWIYAICIVLLGIVLMIVFTFLG